MKTLSAKAKISNRMKKPILILAVVGALLISSVWLFLHKPDEGGFAELFSFEPQYEGHTFTYWMHHWYNNPWGGSVNAEAEVALQSMGAKATPYLVSWISKRPTEGLDFNYPGYALKGFEALGPVAKPAVPDLINMIGPFSHQDYPMRALLFIGRDAVSPLAEKLLETLADINKPITNWRDPGYQTNVFRVQGCVIQTLNQMGTNAEAALPALIKCLNSKTSLHQAEAASALASVGRNQPDVVIPVLISAFTNLNLPLNNNNKIFFGWNSGSVPSAIAGALGSIGGSRPNVVIPFLNNVLTKHDAKTANRGAVAGALAQVGNNQPDIILPVLIYVLTNGDANAADRDSIAGSVASVGHGQPDFIVPALIFAFTNSTIQAQAGIADALATLGSDSQSAIPFLRLAGQSEDWRLRARAAIAVKTIAPQTPNALAPLIKNLESQDGYARYRALYELGKLGTNGAEALPALVKCLHDTNSQMRTDTERCIQNINQFSDEIIIALGENLSYTNSFTSGEAWATLGKFAARSKFAFVTLVKKGISSPVDKDVREQSKWVLINISRDDPKFMLECLDDSDAGVRS
jgi:HEAT repeat protein